MAEIIAKYDTKEKTLTVTLDGKAFDGTITSVNFYEKMNQLNCPYCGDMDEDGIEDSDLEPEYYCNICCEDDAKEEEGYVKRQVISASNHEVAQAALKAGEASAWDYCKDLVVTKLNKLHTDIKAFFKKG